VVGRGSRPYLGETHARLNVKGVRLLPEAQRCARKRVGPDPRGPSIETQAGADGARVTFLQEAIRSIDTTLDLDNTARRLVDVAVPGFADFASVHLYDHVTATEEEDSAPPAPQGAAVIHRAAAAHNDDTRCWELQTGSTFVYKADTAMARFLADIEPVLIPRVGKDTLRQLPGELDSPAARSLLLDSSVILAPLTTHGSDLGFLVFGRRPGRPAFGTADLTACTEIAERAALSLHNTRVYSREARTSAVLQRSLLPARPPRLPGVEIAYRYHPASHTTQVGGDWLDAIPLPGHRVGFVVGDVAGHGLRAAVVMGQLRTAVRTLATLDLPPAQLLTRLDQLAQRLGHTQLATCLYCVYDPIARRCTFASAGHLPPILVSPDGGNELVKVPVGAPIGVGGLALDTVDVPIDSGSLLVLCTDGLVETREQDIEDGLLALRRELTSPRSSLEETCDALLRQQHRDGHHDDIAVLMARLHGIPHDNVATWLFPPRPEQVRVARGLIRDTLTGWGLLHVCDVTQLLAGELLTNAVRHASQPVGLRLIHTDTLLCEVTDDQQTAPSLLQPAETDEHGRGISVINKLATRWGYTHTPAGKAVWFEQNLPAAPHVVLEDRHPG
jgi:hypothetical protein